MPFTLIRRIFLSVLSVLGAIMACLALYYLLVNTGRTPPQIWQNPTMYPNAQNVKVEDVNIQDKGYETVKKIISFETNDSSKEVLLFYANVFSESGWTSTGSYTNE